MLKVVIGSKYGCFFLSFLPCIAAIVVGMCPLFAFPSCSFGLRCNPMGQFGNRMKTKCIGHRAGDTDQRANKRKICTCTHGHPYEKATEEETVANRYRFSLICFVLVYIRSGYGKHIAYKW